ncbi:hypothetical protein M408DRAFT_331407 [Serendipita vermifera MAFF 305830]|uniref:Uncharacterized protein n=1 Tax=Serendipita vermifera MAFF 305830 TaxID=933852 RepID=A0A0C2WFE1_SERVB|nr:hypothetical protein M408DRAFT_331407 [Serendipita vermifera MAFF 305830]
MDSELLSYLGNLSIERSLSVIKAEAETTTTTKTTATTTTTDAESIAPTGTTFALWSTGPVKSFSTTWVVPTKPESNGEFFIYNCIAPPNQANALTMLQGLLHWKKPTDSTKCGWTVSSRYSSGKSTTFTDAVEVAEGDTVTAIISLEEYDRKKFTYKSIISRKKKDENTTEELEKTKLTMCDSAEYTFSVVAYGWSGIKSVSELPGKDSKLSVSGVSVTVNQDGWVKAQIGQDNYTTKMAVDTPGVSVKSLDSVASASVTFKW